MADADAGHVPVLTEPLLRLMDPRPGQTFFDGTVGLGGHAVHILPRLMPDGRYIGVDADAVMLAQARTRVAEWGAERVSLVHGSYADVSEILRAHGDGAADHLLLDLGVNSAQLADPQRGFSFDREGPLDMRYDTQAGQSASDLVNALPERELADLFYHYGQERASRRVAKRICQARRTDRITTTRVLANVVEAALRIPGRPPRGKIHPATRVFQALRIVVNRELENLERFLEQVVSCLRPGGTVGVISFHSIEDGLVKRFVREQRAAGQLEDLTRRPVIADEEERRRNPRSRSAKLRVARRN